MELIEQPERLGLKKHILTCGSYIECFGWEAAIVLEDDVLLRQMCDNICKNKTQGLYDGAYRAVELAMGLKKGEK